MQVIFSLILNFKTAILASDLIYGAVAETATIFNYSSARGSLLGFANGGK